MEYGTQALDGGLDSRVGSLGNGYAYAESRKKCVVPRATYNNAVRVIIVVVRTESFGQSFDSVKKRRVAAGAGNCRSLERLLGKVDVVKGLQS